MKFVKLDTSTPANYFTYFEADMEERKILLKYLDFLVSDSAYERVASDGRFAPSLTWRQWASGTFVGISGDYLLIKSGHRFMSSQEAMDYLPANETPSLLRSLRKCIAKIRQCHRYGTIKRNFQTFSLGYTEFKSPSLHKVFLESHGFVYLRMLEVFNLAELCSPPTAVIEVGGGACVQAAIMINAYNSKYVIIDLPETIAAGFAYLKTVFPDLRIALPDLVATAIQEGEDFESIFERYDVVFLLPYQVDFLPNARFDLAINISSFQEMNIQVVNEYLKLFQRVVCPDGQLILENLKISRETSGNSFDRYCLDGFSVEKICDPWYADQVVRFVPGLHHFFYQGRRSQSVCE